MNIDFTKHKTYFDFINSEEYKNYVIAALVAGLVLSPTASVAAEQCQTFSDGVTVCYPVGGGSTYGK